MIETLPTVSPKTIGFKLSGKLHDEDYKSFMPTVESFLAAEGKARLFVQFEDFHGWDLHAVWDDTKFAFKHYSDFDRIAMVGDRRWENGWPRCAGRSRRRRCGTSTLPRSMRLGPGCEKGSNHSPQLDLREIAASLVRP